MSPPSTSPLQTRVTELLGCNHPILQTGMGWVATPPLVAAASNAGAFGFLAAATIPPESVEDAIEEIQAATDRPFGVNFLMDAPGADVITDAIIRKGVRAAGYNRAPSADRSDHFMSAKCTASVGTPPTASVIASSNIKLRALWGAA